MCEGSRCVSASGDGVESREYGAGAWSVTQPSELVDRDKSKLSDG